MQVDEISVPRTEEDTEEHVCHHSEQFGETEVTKTMTDRVEREEALLL